MKVFDIVNVDFGKGEGSEQSGVRPAVVLSCYEKSPVMIVAPITSQKKPPYPFHASLESLPKPSIALCEQVRSISKTRVINTFPTKLTEAERERTRKAFEFISQHIGDR